jgi:CO/xanthine dehydrogenase Mo-binding subunit
MSFTTRASLSRFWRIRGCPNRNTSPLAANTFDATQLPCQARVSIGRDGSAHVRSATTDIGTGTLGSYATAAPDSPYLTPVSSSETAHNLRPTSGSVPSPITFTFVGHPRISPDPSGP